MTSHKLYYGCHDRYYDKCHQSSLVQPGLGDVAKIYFSDFFSEMVRSRTLNSKNVVKKLSVFHTVVHSMISRKILFG